MNKEKLEGKIYAYGNVIADFVGNMFNDGFSREETSFWLRRLDEEDRKEFLDGTYGEGEEDE